MTLNNNILLETLPKLEANRALILSYLEDLTVDQYNLIPAGSNNNIVWNIGHILVSGDSMLYKNVQGQRPVYDFDISKYTIGSKPDEQISYEEIISIREELGRTVEKFRKVMESDMALKAGAKQEDEIEYMEPDKLKFLFFHENMHYAKIASLMQHFQHQA